MIGSCGEIYILYVGKYRNVRYKLIGNKTKQTRKTEVYPFWNMEEWNELFWKAIQS